MRVGLNRIRRVLVCGVMLLGLVPPLLQSGAAYATPSDIGPWATASNNLPTGLGQATSVEANGFVYVIGGYASSGGVTQNAYYSALHADGSVGPWTLNVMPTTRYAASAVVSGSYLYVFGGYDGTGTSTSSVIYSHLNADGSLGPWESGTNLPEPRSAATAIAAGGRVYVLAGYNNIPQNHEATIYTAALNADGSLGAWTTEVNALPQDRLGATSIVDNGFVYVIGGYHYDSNIGYVAQPTVFYAHLNADGSTGPWLTAANALPDGRAYSSSVLVNGTVYIFGGANNVDPQVQSTVFYAQLNADGTAGSWATSQHPLPIAMVTQTSIFANGFAYVIGGEYDSTIADTVYYTPVVSFGAPTGLSAVSPTSNAPVLTWDPNPNAVSYQIWRQDSSTGNNTQVGTSLTPNFTDSYVPGIYEYTVIAVDAGGQTSLPSASIEVAVTNPAAPHANEFLAQGNTLLLPVFGSDILPGLTSAGQSNKVSFDFDLAYVNNLLTAKRALTLTYNANGHTFFLTSDALTWLVVDGPNNSHGTFEGPVDVTLDGTTTTRYVRISGVDGQASGATNHLSMIVYTDASKSTVLYRVDQDLAKGKLNVK